MTGAGFAEWPGGIGRPKSLSPRSSLSSLSLHDVDMDPASTYAPAEDVAARANEGCGDGLSTNSTWSSSSAATSPPPSPSIAGISSSIIMNVSTLSSWSPTSPVPLRTRLHNAGPPRPTIASDTGASVPSSSPGSPAPIATFPLPPTLLSRAPSPLLWQGSAAAVADGEFLLGLRDRGQSPLSHLHHEEMKHASAHTTLSLRSLRSWPSSTTADRDDRNTDESKTPQTIPSISTSTGMSTSPSPPPSPYPQGPSLARRRRPKKVTASTPATTTNTGASVASSPPGRLSPIAAAVPGVGLADWVTGFGQPMSLARRSSLHDDDDETEDAAASRTAYCTDFDAYESKSESPPTAHRLTVRSYNRDRSPRPLRPRFSLPPLSSPTAMYPPPPPLPPPSPVVQQPHADSASAPARTALNPAAVKDGESCRGKQWRSELRCASTKADKARCCTGDVQFLLLAPDARTDVEYNPGPDVHLKFLCGECLDCPDPVGFDCVIRSVWGNLYQEKPLPLPLHPPLAGSVAANRDARAAMREANGEEEEKGRSGAEDGLTDDDSGSASDSSDSSSGSRSSGNRSSGRSSCGSSNGADEKEERRPQRGGHPPRPGSLQPLHQLPAGFHRPFRLVPATALRDQERVVESVASSSARVAAKKRKVKKRGGRGESPVWSYYGFAMCPGKPPHPEGCWPWPKDPSGPGCSRLLLCRLCGAGLLLHPDGVRSAIGMAKNATSIDRHHCYRQGDKPTSATQIVRAIVAPAAGADAARLSIDDVEVDVERRILNFQDVEDTLRSTVPGNIARVLRTLMASGGDFLRIDALLERLLEPVGYVVCGPIAYEKRRVAMDKLLDVLTKLWQFGLVDCQPEPQPEEEQDQDRDASSQAAPKRRRKH